MGTESSTLKGSDQLSYSAARTRNTKAREIPKTHSGPARGAPLLVGEVGPVVAHLAGQHLAGDFLEGRHGLAGAVTRRGLARHLGRAEEVEPLGVLGAEDPARRDDRREREHVSGVVPDVEAADVFGRRAVFGLRLQEDAPLPAEPVELVHVTPPRNACRVW